jgi:hypothetical protein
MEFWTNIILFFIILIFYLHLQNEWKKSEDLEIFEMEYISNEDLHEVCKLKQPVIFQMDHLSELEDLFHFIPDNKEEMQIKDIRDYYLSTETKTVDGITLSYKSAYGLCETDNKGIFFSENNNEIMVLENKKKFDKMSALLSPSLTILTKYDYCFGSAKSYTPVRYHTDSCRFLTVLSGQGIRVKMCPWKNNKQFNSIQDYENYEFWSKIDIWKNTNLKCLEFDVKPGYVFHIPSYWFYSIQYIKINENGNDNVNSVSTIASFHYITIMNIISNLKHYGLYFLQQQNIVNTKSSVLKQKENEEKEIIDIKIEEKKENTMSNEISDTIAMLQVKNEMNNT